MKLKLKIFTLLLAFSLLLTGCTGTSDPASDNTEQTTPTTGSTGPNTDNSNDSAAASSGLFSERDFNSGYSEEDSALIRLNGTTAQCTSDAVQISGSTVTILDEGTYILTGTLDDGMIIVNADKEDKTHLVFDGVTVHSQACAPLYILQADKVFLTLADGSENILSNGGTFTAMDDNNIDSVIFSKEDLTLNGTGTLSITSPAGHGIVSKDELTVTGGTYTVSAASHGLTGKDSICIADANMVITSGKDGIHAENDEDTSLGFLYISGGTFAVEAEGDGLSASSTLQIDSGTFDIVTGGGSVNAPQQTSDAWGNMGGHGGMGGMGPMGGNGGMGGRGDMGGKGPMGGDRGGSVSSTAYTTSATDSEDSTSIKGIKSSGSMTISGGTFTLDCADDAVHSNSTLTVTGGTFTIATGDDGFHADEALTIHDGTVLISESYEGLEGLSIDLYGGSITLTADDDGLNAAGGTDQSGMGGFRGGDRFGAGSDSYINLAGGTLDIHASGDGIDSNGTLTISGGFVTVCGPTSGDTSVLDFESTGTITGGTFIGSGAYMMAQTFGSNSTQGVIALRVGNQPAGTAITLTDGDGNTLISHTPDLSFAIVILSSPELTKGKSYTVSIGENTGVFAAS